MLGNLGHHGEGVDSRLGCLVQHRATIATFLGGCLYVLRALRAGLHALWKRLVDDQVSSAIFAEFGVSQDFSFTKEALNLRNVCGVRNTKWLTPICDDDLPGCSAGKEYSWETNNRPTALFAPFYVALFDFLADDPIAFAGKSTSVLIFRSETSIRVFK